MLVALIDDGIDTSVCPCLRIKYDLSVGADGVVRNRAANDRVLTDHGTTCARIIAKYAPNAEFCSLRIFHKEQLRASCRQLVAAMEWCLAAQVPIVHMSLGTSQANDFNQIRSMAARMIQQQQIIVAACSNSGAFSVPSGLNGVLGVVADKGLADDEFSIEFVSAGYNLIRASSRHELVLSSGQAFTTQVTNSYAAPTITAAVHKILEQRGALSMSATQVFTELARDKGKMTFARPDFIEDAIILNPTGVPILKQHLFFHCQEEILDPSNLESNDTCSQSLVYLVPKGSDFSASTEGILHKAGTFKSLLYGGRLPDREKNILYSGLVWSEDCCTYPECISDNLRADLPVINLFGHGLKAIDVICQLRDLFAEDGYHCRGLCDFPYSYLYDLEFLPKDASPESAFASISRIFQPDIVINNFQIPGHEIAVGQDDYSILLEDEGNYTNGFLTNNRCYVKSAYDKNDILLLYNNILSCFL